MRSSQPVSHRHPPERRVGFRYGGKFTPPSSLRSSSPPSFLPSLWLCLSPRFARVKPPVLTATHPTCRPRVGHVWALRHFVARVPHPSGSGCSARRGGGFAGKPLKFQLVIIRAFLCDKLLRKKFEQEIDGLFMKDSSRSLNIIIRLIFSNAY